MPLKLPDNAEAEQRGADLRGRFTVEELREFFIRREHDSLFNFVGEPVTSPFAPAHAAVWNGYAIAVGNQYARHGELAVDESTE